MICIYLVLVNIAKFSKLATSIYTHYQYMYLTMRNCHNILPELPVKVSQLVSLSQHLAFYHPFATQHSKNKNDSLCEKLIFEQRYKWKGNLVDTGRRKSKCNVISWPIYWRKARRPLRSVESGKGRKVMGDVIRVVARVQIMQRNLEFFWMWWEAIGEFWAWDLL